MHVGSYTWRELSYKILPYKILCYHQDICATVTLFTPTHEDIHVVQLTPENKVECI